MAQEGVVNTEEKVVIVEERDHVGVIVLNRPRQLNVISSKMVSLLSEYLQRWEKDETIQLIIMKGSGRAFSAGGDLRMFYEGKTSKDSCLEVVYRMYWLMYHIHTYRKTQVALVHGICMGGGASLALAMTFSVVTEKTVFSAPEVSIGFHTDCSLSYILSRLSGCMGEFLALTGTRLSGKEMVAIGLATHFVPLESLADLESRLKTITPGDLSSIESTIEGLSLQVQVDDDSVLNNIRVINECFSKSTVEEILACLKLEASKQENGWIGPVLEGLNRSSPTSLKIILRSIREGRKQSLDECLRKEFRITMNILRTLISCDVYEGIRALSIDKDNKAMWFPCTLSCVKDEDVDKVFVPFKEGLELQIRKGDHRWSGKYEESLYATPCL